jgi:hypothetical protein
MAKMVVENIKQPGKTYRVDEAKYAAMRAAYLKVLPSRPPGLTPAEIQRAFIEHLPADVFPGGEKAGWWSKCVQLDLEAKKIIVRSKSSPVRLWRA